MGLRLDGNQICIYSSVYNGDAFIVGCIVLAVRLGDIYITVRSSLEQRRSTTIYPNFYQDHRGPQHLLGTSLDIKGLRIVVSPTNLGGISTCLIIYSYSSDACVVSINISCVVTFAWKFQH